MASIARIVRPLFAGVANKLSLIHFTGPAAFGGGCGTVYVSEHPSLIVVKFQVIELRPDRIAGLAAFFRLVLTSRNSGTVTSAQRMLWKTEQNIFP